MIRTCIGARCDGAALSCLRRSELLATAMARAAAASIALWAAASLSLGLSTAAGADLGTWQRTGPLLVGVENPTLTVLPSGKALLAGGARAGGSSSAETHSTTAEAELYDPSLGTWSATGSMATPRILQTATVLPLGKVLIAGGEDGPNHSTASAELYDPSTGAWSPTAGHMFAKRAGQTATLLPSGKVLVIGGNYGQGPTAELYDPDTDIFEPTEKTPGAASEQAPVDPAFHTATLLESGEVLVTGGIASANGGYSQTAAAELYDPVTNTWAQTGSMLSARDLQTATLLPSGEVLIAGGYNAEQGTLASAELYDPSTGVFSATTSMGLGRWEPSAALLGAGTDEGEVLLDGGNLGAVTEAGPRASAAEVYDPALGNWTATAPTSFPRLEQKAALLPSGQVLVAGGDLGTPANSLSSVELFTPTQTSPATRAAAHNSRATRHRPRVKHHDPRAQRQGMKSLTRRSAHRKRVKHTAVKHKSSKKRGSQKAHKPTGKHKRSTHRVGEPLQPADSTDPPGAAGQPGSAGPQGPAGTSGPLGLPATKGGVMIQIGDSLTAYGFDYAQDAAHSASTGDIGAISPNNWGMWAALDSQGRIRYGGAAATAGFTSAQILAATQELFATPPSRPIAYATVLAGTNDVGYELPLATSQANLTAIYDLLVAHGITPILCTLPPRNGAEFGQPPETITRQRNATLLLNQWIAHTAQVNDWPLVDLYSALVDPATGEYKPGLNTDFLHQNSAGAQVMGAVLANALANYPSQPPLLADTQADTVYGVGNNLFLNSIGGLPEDWQASGSPTLEVTSDPAVQGDAFSITRGPTENGVAWTSTPMPVQQGDVVYLAGRIQSNVQATGGNVYYRLISFPSHSTSVFGLYDWNRDVIGSGQWGTFAVETTVPNLGGDDALQLQALVDGPSGTQLKLAQVTLLNLTQSGVLP
jgi:lysophospholipase L1-like esterase